MTINTKINIKYNDLFKVKNFMAGSFSLINWLVL